MQPEEDLVSVVVPVYNGERFLAEALDSILAQDYNLIEVIVVDDGSTDGTSEVAAQYGSYIRYVYQQNRRTPAARNTGLRMVKGNLICFLDADDVWTDIKLKSQLALLKQNPSAEVVLGRLRHWPLPMKYSQCPSADEAWQGFSLGCALIRESVFDKIGRFDESLYYHDDWDWFSRAREVGVSFLLHEDVVLLCRRHDQNITKNTQLSHQYLLQMLHKSIHRRKSPGQIKG
jgi:glycosyltransferase involved in cell wall biosynthesis